MPEKRKFQTFLILELKMPHLLQFRHNKNFPKRGDSATFMFVTSYTKSKKTPNKPTPRK